MINDSKLTMAYCKFDYASQSTALSLHSLGSSHMMSICFQTVFQLHKHFHDTSDSACFADRLYSCLLQMIGYNLAEGTTSSLLAIPIFLNASEISLKTNLVWLAEVNLLFWSLYSWNLFIHLKVSSWLSMTKLLVFEWLSGKVVCIFD